MRAAKIDSNQRDIVSALRKLPGVTVETGHDDILVGYGGRTFWIEIKHPDCISKKTGLILESEITDSERKRLNTWMGHYAICWTLDQVLDIIY
jgi:hypothetical protein